MCAGFDFTFVNGAIISVPSFHTQIATLLSALVDDDVVIVSVVIWPRSVSCVHNMCCKLAHLIKQFSNLVNYSFGRSVMRIQHETNFIHSTCLSINSINIVR